MDKPILIIDAPELCNEAVAGMQNFLQELMNAFDSHYYYRQKYYEKPSCTCAQSCNALNEKISYNTILDLLVGDLRTEESLAAVLNFLEYTASVIRHLYRAKKLSNQGKKK